MDVSKASVYLFENVSGKLRLIADYYVSVGKTGFGKDVEGDQRTPLGIYFITSNLNPKSLKDLYGSGALPINYPNALDIRRAKTGSGIWVHGTPASQFTRAPLATDGCVAVSNPDLDRIIRTVEIRATPVLIAKALPWVAPKNMDAEKQEFAAVLQSWAQAKSDANPLQIMRFYDEKFTADPKTLAAQALRNSTQKARAAQMQTKLSEVSFMHWTDEANIVVATFGEVTASNQNGRTIRQYWQRQSKQWKILYEAVVG